MSESPPADALAEAMVLGLLLQEPERIAGLELGRELVFCEHQACWQSMARVHIRSPGLGATEFFLAWRRDLCEHECLRPPAQQQHEFWEEGRCRAKHLWWSLAWAPDNALRRGRLLDDGRTICDREGCERPGRHPPHTQPFEFWLERIHAVTEARRIIQAAQEVAEKAWRLDLDGARQAASRAARLPSAPPVWERNVS